MKHVGYKSRAYLFVVSYEFNPDDICNRLAVRSDDAIWRGSKNPSGTPELHPFNLVVFRSRLKASEDMEKHALDLLDRISPIYQKIKSLPKHCHASINFTYSMPQNGGWNFGARTLKAIAKLGLECVFSLDILRRDKSQP